MSDYENKNSITHPRGLYFASRASKKSLSVESHLSAVDKGDDMPLKTHNKFSRYVWIVIDPGKPRGSLRANMSAKEVPSFLRRADSALNRLALPDREEKDGGKSPAYTETLSFGTYKGKSPAEALITDGESAVEVLKGAYKLLKGNLEKYPRNQKKMDAIEEAVKLFRDGKLESGSLATSEYILHKSGPRPLERKEKKDGKSPVFEMNIFCRPSEASPFFVEIESYYAPVTHEESGQIKVMKSDAEENQTNTFGMTYEEFATLTDAIEKNYEQFMLVNGARVFKLSDEAFWEQRKDNGNTPDKE